jgi:hypothetical protein
MSIAIIERSNAIDPNPIAFIVEKATILLLVGTAWAALVGVITGAGADLPMLLP